MALFAPAAGYHPLQYAGQQLPNFQQQPQQVFFCSKHILRWRVISKHFSP